MRRIATPAIAGLAIFAVAACSADEGDFSSEAESFIEDEEEDVAQAMGITFTDAACDEPASTDVDTTFACTAVGSDGATYDFLATIEGDNSFSIQPGAAGAGGAPSGSTPTSGAPTATTTTTG